MVSVPVIVGHPATVMAQNIGDTCETGNAEACLKSGAPSEIMKFILMVIRFLAASVFVIAVIMLIAGGIQYMTANGNPQSVAKAKTKITDVFIGLLAFIFLWAFLEWLVPGGILDITN